MQLAAHVPSATALEAACGLDPALQIFGGEPPADCTHPDAGSPIWRARLPPGWQRAAADGVLCQLRPDAGWLGHWRLIDAAGVCCAQGRAAVDVAAGAEIVLQVLPMNALLTLRFEG